MVRHGYDVDMVNETHLAFQKPLHSYDVSIVDWDLPGHPRGLELARGLRSKNRGLGIVMLDGLVDPVQRRRALEEIADDCLPRDCDAVDLIVRLKALARRLGNAVSGSSTRHWGPVSVNFTGGFAQIQSKEVLLQPLQLRILGFLLENAGRVITHEELRQHVFRVAQTASSSSLSRQMSVLRKRLGPAGEMIVTTRGGYGIGIAQHHVHLTHDAYPTEGSIARARTELKTDFKGRTELDMVIDANVISTSPDLLLQRSAPGPILTRPIKGTRQRGRDAVSDSLVSKSDAMPRIVLPP